LKSRRIILHILDFGILLSAGVILYVIILGGFEIHALGYSIKCTGLSNPSAILLFLVFLRLFIAIDLKNSLILLASVIFAASLGEVLLRIVSPQIAEPSLKEITEPSQVLGYRMVPGLKGRGIQINSHGLRDEERQWQKPAGVKRILGIGDSFTFGYQVRLDECYLKQLEKRLNQDGELWEVINAGVSGYNMWQYLRYFENYGYRYGAELVTIGVFFDDFRDEPPPASREIATDREKYRSFSFLKLSNLIRNSIELLAYRFRFLFNTPWLSSIDERKRYILKNGGGSILTGSADPELYVNFERQLSEIKRLAAVRDVPIIVVLIPDIIQLNEPEFQKVNRIVESICSGCDVKFLDMTPVFERRADIRNLYLMPYDAHTSPEGHRIIAEELEWIIRNKTVGGRRVGSYPDFAVIGERFGG
jgi:lysophospholipase L1-like esterase